MTKLRKLAAVGALTALLGGATTFLAGHAGAADAAHTDTVAVQLTDWAEDVELPQFDPDLGILRSITIESEASVAGTGRVENTGPNAQTPELSLGARVTIATGDPDLGTITLTPEASRDIPLDPFDGAEDFDGASGETVIDLVGTESDTATINDPTKFGPYIGTGSLTMATNAAGRSAVFANGNVASEFETMAGASVTIIYRYVVPSINIAKTPDDQIVAPGDDATFDITVTNDGEVDLTDVSVSDPIAPACDSQIASLAIGANSTYQCTLTDVTNSLVNVATATGTAEDRTVQDSDEAKVDVPGITLTKTASANLIVIGDIVTFTFDVENTGTVALTDVAVVDSFYGNCDKAIGDLAPNETVSYDCVVDGITSDIINIATVTGKAGDIEVTDSDHAEVTIAQPSIDIEKFVNGDDADALPGVAVEAGEDVTFSFTVTNTGGTIITNIAVHDDVLGDITCPESELAPSATMSCDSVTAPASAGEHTNVASVTGDAPNDTEVLDTDPGNYTATVTIPEPPITTVPCPADEILTGLSFTANGVTAASLTNLDIRSGDTVVMTWDGYTAGNEGCDVSLAIYKAHADTFDVTDNQELLVSAWCVPGTTADCVQSDGSYALSILVPATDEPCPLQIDAVTGIALPIVGPNGSFYSSVLTLSTNRLFSARYQTNPQPRDDVDPVIIGDASIS